MSYRSLLTVLMLLLPIVGFSQSSNWNSAIDLNVSVNSSDRIDLYTDKDGNHVIVQKSNQLVYYLFSATGSQVRTSTRDNNVSEDPRLSRIVGWQGELYIIYKEGDKIKIQKSTDAGANWSTTVVNEITMNNSTSNGLDAWTDADGIHLVYSEYDNGNYKTWYQRNDGDTPNWVEQKQITDETNVDGGFPSVTTSANRVHVAFVGGDQIIPSTANYPTKTRDQYNSSWQSSQDLIDESCLARIISDGTSLHGFYYEFYIGPLGLTFGLHHRTRTVSGSSWTNTPTALYPNTDPVNSPIEMGVTSDDVLHIAYSTPGDIYYSLWDGSWETYFIVFSGSYANQQLSVNSNDVYVIWIADKEGGYTIKLRQRDFAPLAPQNLTASAAGIYQPVVLNWTANSEADLSQYKIYRAFNYSPTPPSSGYDNIATINAYSGNRPVTSYTDWESAAYPSSMWLHYKIKAQDIAANQSGYSNTASYNAFLKTPAGAEDEVVVSEYSLEQNYPNPFNPNTTIQFALPEAQEVEVAVYNLTGQKITTLAAGVLEKGFHQVEWDGKDAQGNAVSSGIYIYQLKAGNQRMVKKMVLAK